MLFWFALVLMILAPIHVLFAALRVWDHGDIFTTLAVLTLKLVPIYFFIGVGILIATSTQWISHHVISIVVK